MKSALLNKVKMQSNKKCKTRNKKKQKSLMVSKKTKKIKLKNMLKQCKNPNSRF